MKKLTKIVSVLLSMVIFASLFITASAADISVMINGTPLSFDVPPQLINDRTMVPMRAIFEGLGALVDWNEETATATAKKGDTVIRITIDSTSMYVGENVVELDSPACIINDRTLVPVRAISEALGCEVAWNGDEYKVEIRNTEYGRSYPTVTDILGIEGEMSDPIFDYRCTYTATKEEMQKYVDVLISEYGFVSRDDDNWMFKSGGDWQLEDGTNVRLAADLWQLENWTNINERLSISENFFDESKIDINIEHNPNRYSTITCPSYEEVTDEPYTVENDGIKIAHIFTYNSDALTKYFEYLESLGFRIIMLGDSEFGIYKNSQWVDSLYFKKGEYIKTFVD